MDDSSIPRTSRIPDTRSSLPRNERNSETNKEVLSFRHFQGPRSSAVQTSPTKNASPSSKRRRGREVESVTLRETRAGEGKREGASEKGEQMRRNESGRKRDVRELFSYVSQNYKTLILELPSARASPYRRKKKGDQRRLRVIVTLFTRSASNCLSLRESGGVCMPLDPWFRRRDRRLRGARGATQRETLDERSTLACQRRAGRRRESRMDRAGMQELDGTRERRDRDGGRRGRKRDASDAGEETRKGTTAGLPAREVGMERSWVQRFLRDVGG